MTAKLLYLARHGETDWNAVGRWQGHTDVPLNATGEAQARALAEVLRGAGLSMVISSDLARAQETARIVAGLLDVPLAYVDVDLRERSFGRVINIDNEQDFAKRRCRNRSSCSYFEFWINDQIRCVKQPRHCFLRARWTNLFRAQCILRLLIGSDSRLRAQIAAGLDRFVNR